MEYRSFALSHGAHFGLRRGFEDDLNEYRNYVQGDDLRFLDWNLFARTDKYYIREGYQRSRQNIFIWLDNSLSLKFSPEKYNTAWLLALSLGYLFRQQKDRVYLFAEDFQFEKNKNVVNLKSPADFIRLDKYFSEETIKKIKTKRNKNSFFSYFNEAGKYLKHSNKVIWITDFYVPIKEFEQILNETQKKGWKMSLVHLTQKDEWDWKKFKSGFLQKMVDVETGTWISSNKIKNYPLIWEEAVKKRTRMLLARNFIYRRGEVEAGPIHILGGMKGI